MARLNQINIEACLWSILSLFATMYSYSDLNDVSFLNHSISASASIVFGVLFFIFYYFFYKHVINKISDFSTQSILIGIFAGTINVLGRNFMLHNSMQFFSKDMFFAVIFSLLATIGYGLIYASVFELGWNYLDFQRTNGLESRNHSSFVSPINHNIFDKHPLFYPFLFICLFWAPYLVAFFPGMLQWDAMYALRSYYGIEIWTNHHPVIGVLLMGYIMDIGKFLGNDNYGCVIYIVLQFLLFSFTLVYNFVFFNHWRVCYVIRWMVLMFFAIHPMFPTFVMNVVKDIYYYVAVLWLLFMFIKCYKQYKRKYFFYITFISVFVCILRKEGIVVCLLCSLLLLFFRQQIYTKWKNILVAMVLGSTLAFFVSTVAGNYYNIKQASVREALSIPIQQTARFVRDYSNDISCREWDILNSVFQDHARELGDYYQPEKSDAVKALMVYSLTKKQRTDYFSVWISQFLRYPGCYFSAAFNQIYGYFYIEKGAMYEIGDCRLVNFQKDHPLYTQQLVVVDNPNTEQIRKILIKYIFIWPVIPLLGLLYHPATYTWLLFLGLSCLVHFKKYRYLFLYSIPLIILCICCLSPVNAFIRYSFPITLCSVILNAFSITVIRNQEKS